MRSVFVFSLISIVAAMVRGESAAVSDTEVWNEGIGYYQQGDVTNALRVLRPLTASGEYKARAAEVVAKLEPGTYASSDYADFLTGEGSLVVVGAAKSGMVIIYR